MATEREVFQAKARFQVFSYAEWGVAAAGAPPRLLLPALESLKKLREWSFSEIQRTCEGEDLRATIDIPAEIDESAKSMLGIRPRAEALVSKDG